MIVFNSGQVHLVFEVAGYVVPSVTVAYIN